MQAYKDLLPVQPIYDPLPYFKKDYFNQKETTSRKPKVFKTNSEKNSFDGYPIGSKHILNLETTTPDENLISKENQKFLNQTAERVLNKKTFWPVTSSRSMHKDEDVFIARANNPFGHSTKLKMTYVLISLNIYFVDLAFVIFFKFSLYASLGI